MQPTTRSRQSARYALAFPRLRLARTNHTCGWILLCLGCLSVAAGKDKPPQYEHDDIVVPGAESDEPTRAAVSVTAAGAYLEQGASAWSENRKCISCHTNGTYMAIRPMLTKHLGPPSESIRQFFVEELQKAEKKEIAALKRGIGPTQIAYLAWGLSEWDAHCAPQVSAETDRALRLMFSLQADDGSWGNEDCWGR